MKKQDRVKSGVTWGCVAAVLGIAMLLIVGAFRVIFSYSGTCMDFGGVPVYCSFSSHLLNLFIYLGYALVLSPVLCLVIFLAIPAFLLVIGAVGFGLGYIDRSQGGRNGW